MFEASSSKRPGVFQLISEKISVTDDSWSLECRFARASTWSPWIESCYGVRHHLTEEWRSISWYMHTLVQDSQVLSSRAYVSRLQQPNGRLPDCGNHDAIRLSLNKKSEPRCTNCQGPLRTSKLTTVWRQNVFSSSQCCASRGIEVLFGRKFNDDYRLYYGDASNRID